MNARGSSEAQTHVNLLPVSVSLHLGLGGEGLHEGLDSVSGVSLLNESNGGVDEEKEDDTDEVLPIGGKASAVGKSNGDERGSLHDPGQRVPHERLRRREKGEMGRISDCVFDGPRHPIGARKTHEELEERAGEARKQPGERAVSISVCGR